MNITFVKYLKDVRKPVTREWVVTGKDKSSYCSSVDNATYYEACYIADFDLQKHGIDEKAVLSLLKKKNEEMVGNGIVKYLETVQASKIVKFLKDFKPYHKEDYETKTWEGEKNGVPCDFVNTITCIESNSAKIAYKVNGEYEYLTAYPAFGEDDTVEEWHRRNDKDKFFFGTFDFKELEETVWKILYRLNNKGYVTERYQEGSVGVNRRGVRYGVKAKRFYTITDSGLEYLKSL